jgi:hypothetical protein
MTQVLQIEITQLEVYVVVNEEKKWSNEKKEFEWKIK